MRTGSKAGRCSGIATTPDGGVLGGEQAEDVSQRSQYVNTARRICHNTDYGGPDYVIWQAVLHLLKSPRLAPRLERRPTGLRGWVARLDYRTG